MKKKENKKTYSVDHVVVILEDMQSSFKVLGDGQQLLNEKFDKLDSKVDKLENNAEVFRGEVMQQFMAVGEGMQVLSDKVDNLEVKVNNMQGDISNMQGDVTEIKHKLSEKVDLKDFQILEKRFIKLEKLVFAKLAH
jgi:chaperonin cofactor prefoldin